MNIVDWLFRLETPNTNVATSPIDFNVIEEPRSLTDSILDDLDEEDDDDWDDDDD